MADIPEGFTKWNGGKNPVPGRVVVAMFRGDLTDDAHLVRRPALSDYLYWIDDGDEFDIIAYKVVEE